MLTPSLLLGLLAVAEAFQFSSLEKAPSLSANCGCQCSSPALTFLDSEGRLQGNCNSADSNGAVWCYVDSGSSSSCRDLRPSSRFPGNPWSYEACTSPPSPSPACPEPICRGEGCLQEPICRHLGNCLETLPILQPVLQPGLQPIHLPILGAITGAIIGALGGGHTHGPTTITTPIPPPITTTNTPQPITTTTTASTTIFTRPPPPPPTSTTTTTTARPTTPTTPTTMTPTQAPDPWLDQITINPNSNLLQGTWGAMELCPPSTYATAFQLLVAPLCSKRCLLDDDVGLMGARLLCSSLQTPAASASVVATVTSSVTANITRVGGGLAAGYGWTSPLFCPSGSHLSGARLLSEFFILQTTETLGPAVSTPPGCPTGIVCRPPSTQNSDPAGALNLDMRCTGSAPLAPRAPTPRFTLSGPGLAPRPDISSWGLWRECPRGAAVCGIRTKIFEGQTDKVSNLGLTDLMLQCCQLPSHVSSSSSPHPVAAPSSFLAGQFQFGAPPAPRRPGGGQVVFG